MKPHLLVCAILLAAQPAMAWELRSEQSKKSWEYVAFQSDKTGEIELQFFCDHLYPDDIQLLLFTNTDAAPGDTDHPDVAVDVTVEGTPYNALKSYYDTVNDERVLVVDTLEEARLRDIIAAASQASKPILVTYAGQTHRFATTAITETLTAFTTGCSEQAGVPD